MATVTTGLTSLKTLFNSVDEIYYKSSELLASDLTGESLTFDMELPVLEDGVTFDTGENDTTQIKLTTGTIWTTKITRGDADISFQVASVAGEVDDLFMTSVTTVSASAVVVDGSTYEGSGYSLAPKKVTGSLLMYSEDKQTVIALSNVEINAHLVAADGDNPAYFEITVVPMESSEGVELFILEKAS